MNKDVSSRLIFGCARLMGGIEQKNSNRLLRSAYDLGIRQYDTAPSYGFGTSEVVLGEFFDGDEDVKLNTKYGIIPKSNANRTILIRKYFSPILKNITPIKNLILRQLSGNEERKNFITEDDIYTGLELSVKRLRCEKINNFLLHNPGENSFDESSMTKFFENNCTLIRNFGVGYNEVFSKSHKYDFGNVVQCRYTPLHVIDEKKINVFHGVIRYKEINEKIYGYNYLTLRDKLKLEKFKRMDDSLFELAFSLAYVLCSFRYCNVIISSSTVYKLESIVLASSDIYDLLCQELDA